MSPAGWQGAGGKQLLVPGAVLITGDRAVNKVDQNPCSFCRMCGGAGNSVL